MNRLWITLLSCTFINVSYGVEPPTTSVVIREVQEIKLGQSTRVSGVVQSRTDLLLSANIEGEFLWVLEPGTRIEAGTVVAKIEDIYLRIDIEEQDLMARRAEINVNYLQGEADRLSKLQKSNMASQTQLAEMRSRRDLAKNDYKVAMSRISRLKEQLERTKITSPVAGIVVSRLRQAFEFARRGEGVVRVVDPTNLEIRASIPLSLLGRLQVGSKLDVKVGGLDLQGQLRSMVAAGDEISQTFEVFIDLPDKIEEIVVDGQFAEVGIHLQDSEKSLLVPRDALVLRSEGNYVFKINKENKARRVSVKLGAGRGDFVTVTGNLQVGDKVAVRGVERLVDGQAVVMESGSSSSS